MCDSSTPPSWVPLGTPLSSSAHLHLDPFRHVHAHQVGVENRAAEVIVLQILDDHLLRVAVDRDVHQPVAVTKALEEIVGVQRDGHGLLLMPVHDGRNPALAAHRGGPFRADLFPRLGLQ